MQQVLRFLLPIGYGILGLVIFYTWPDREYQLNNPIAAPEVMRAAASPEQLVPEVPTVDNSGNLLRPRDVIETAPLVSLGTNESGGTDLERMRSTDAALETAF